MKVCQKLLFQQRGGGEGGMGNAFIYEKTIKNSQKKFFENINARDKIRSGCPLPLFRE